MVQASRAAVTEEQVTFRPAGVHHPRYSWKEGRVGVWGGEAGYIRGEQRESRSANPSPRSSFHGFPLTLAGPGRMETSFHTEEQRALGSSRLRHIPLRPPDQSPPTCSKQPQEKIRGGQHLGEDVGLSRGDSTQEPIKLTFGRQW